MEKFLKEKIEYVPLSRVDDLLRQIGKVTREELIAVLKYDYRRMKFFSPNVFAFINVYNEKLFYLNGRVLIEVVRMLQDRYIIGSKDLQTLGDLFEQLLNKGFKQDEGQFFTPIPITHFIWDSLPLDKIIRDNNGEPPKIIDYACGAGHFLTEGYQAVNDCFTRNSLTPPVLWERDKIFGIEKDPRLATVSKISLFMHGAGEGKIKFGEGLEDYPDENILPETFDVLVANPPYSIRGFKTYLQLANEKFSVLDKISNDGSEIETLFVERISQLIKPRGVAAVILPSSILNKDGKSFIAARESLLKNFYVRAIVQLGSKTFGATGTNTVILFLQRIFDPPERARLLKDSAKIILHDAIQTGDEEEEIFAAYTKKIGISPYDYKKFIAEADEKTIKLEREKIIYFGLTYRQMTLIVTAPADNKEQEIFLGYGWSNAKGREGIVDKKRGGLLFDNGNRTAENTIAAVIRAAFRGEQVNLPALKKYFRYATLSDLLDFDAVNFTKTITLGEVKQAEYSGKFPTVKLGDVCEINPPKSEVADVDDDTPVSFVEMASVSNDGFIAEKVTRPLGEVRKGGYKYFAEGDIIIAKITPCMENGKCAIARGLTNSIGFGSTEFHVFRCNADKILTDYLFVFLNREEIRQTAQKVMTGASGHRRVPETFYSKLIVPLPPLDVQKKIVDEFNALDAQIDSCEQTIHSLDADVQKKFTALFADLTEQIEIGQCCEIVKGANLTREQAVAGEVPVVAGGILPSCYHNLANRPANIISVSASGKNAGYVNFWRVPIFATDCNTLQSKNYFSTLYIYYALKNIQDDIYKLQRGSAQPHVYGNDIAKLKIPNAPLELQEEFTSYVSTCESMKKSARERRDKLIHSRGELVMKYFR